MIECLRSQLAYLRVVRDFRVTISYRRPGFGGRLDRTRTPGRFVLEVGAVEALGALEAAAEAFRRTAGPPHFHWSEQIVETEVEYMGRIPGARGNAQAAK